MRYKWIALVLACALLLCGCAPIEPIESAGGSAQTTATTVTTTVQTTAQTTAQTTVLASTSKTTSATTKTATTTTARGTICDGLGAPAPVAFSNIQVYEEALKKANSLEALKKVLPVSSRLVTDSELEQRMTMLLRDKFFLVPDLSAITEDVHVSLHADGVTYVSFQYGSKPSKHYVHLWIYHYELPESQLSATKDKEAFVNSYTTSAGLSVTENSPQDRIFEVEGYHAVLTAPDDAFSDDFVDKLTFRKVEIK